MAVNISPSLVIQLISALATVGLGCVAVWNIREYRKERKMKLIERKLDEFYFPLIYLLTPRLISRSRDEISKIQKINRILTEKRYLAEPRTLEVLPTKFEALLEDKAYVFTNRASYEKWKTALKVLWEDAQELIKKYYELAGIKEYKLPEEPKWAIEYSEPRIVY